MQNQNNMQAMMDGFSMQWQKERATSQMTLGGLIKRLKELNPETLIKFNNPDSYRGYYDDLAFAPNETGTKAELLLVECQNSMGKVFHGYKGGDYMMGENTPVWIANYGDCGDKLISISDDGQSETKQDD